MISKGLRASKIKNSKDYEPISVTRIQIKFYFSNEKYVNSVYSKMWDSLKTNKNHIGLLQVGIDSSTATFIEEQKINHKGLLNSEFKLTKSGIGENYICLSYRKDNQ
jgi:hypothetical protein